MLVWGSLRGEVFCVRDCGLLVGVGQTVGACPGGVPIVLCVGVHALHQSGGRREMRELFLSPVQCPFAFRGTPLLSFERLKQWVGRWMPFLVFMTVL